MRISIAKTDDIEPGKVRGFEVEGTRILVANLNGNYFAIGSVCSHVGGPLEKGRLEGDVITCPWHGSRFDVTNGVVIGGPATKPEPSYKLEVSGRELFIEL